MYLRVLAFCLIFVPGAFLSSPARAEDRLVIFAASSLQTALDRIAEAWQHEGGAEIVISYGASSALARQIMSGAPADLFLSASTDWMDAVENDKAVRSGSRVDLLGNALVLVGHGPGPDLGELGSDLDLDTLLEDGRLAMAYTDAVPAGIYGRQALTTLGLWDRFSTRIAQFDNVRAALAIVATGELPLGIVYRSDALVERGVSLVGTFPADSHDPIRYPIAITTESKHPDAAEFVAFLQGEEAGRIFLELGFDLIGQEP